jgi:DNA-binding transcriptional MocR family regulator
MAYYLDHYSLDSHIEWITGIYKKRKDLMAKVIDEKFPKTVCFKNPGGGLFIWLELPAGKDGRELLKRSLKRKVSFIPGTSFYPAGDRHNEIRLNFSNMKPERIIEGMSILAEITAEYLNE